MASSSTTRCGRLLSSAIMRGTALGSGPLKQISFASAQRSRIAGHFWIGRRRFRLHRRGNAGLIRRVHFRRIALRRLPDGGRGTWRRHRGRGIRPGGTGVLGGACFVLALRTGLILYAWLFVWAARWDWCSPRFARAWRLASPLAWAADILRSGAPSTSPASANFPAARSPLYRRRSWAPTADRSTSPDPSAAHARRLRGAVRTPGDSGHENGLIEAQLGDGQSL